MQSYYDCKKYILFKYSLSSVYSSKRGSYIRQSLLEIGALGQESYSRPEDHVCQFLQIFAYQWQ